MPRVRLVATAALQSGGGSGTVSGQRTGGAADPPWPLPAGWRGEVIPFPPGFFDPASGEY